VRPPRQANLGNRFSPAIRGKHIVPQKHVLKGRTIQVLIKDPNVDEKFFRISDYPPNVNIDALKVRLGDFGTLLDIHQDQYAKTIAVMVPCLTVKITVRMTLSSTIPSYLQVDDLKKVYVR
jgi:hypothetical protein